MTHSLFPLARPTAAPDRARQRAGVGDPGIATVERDLDHVVGQRVDSRRTQCPGRRGSDRHMVGRHRIAVDGPVWRVAVCHVAPASRLTAKRVLAGGEDEVCRAWRPDQLAGGGQDARPGRGKEWTRDQVLPRSLERQMPASSIRGRSARSRGRSAGSRSSAARTAPGRKSAIGVRAVRRTPRHRRSRRCRPGRRR